MTPHNGYVARVEYDAEDKILFGRLAGITDGSGFQAETVADLKIAFHEAVDDSIETCAKIGKDRKRRESGRSATNSP